MKTDSETPKPNPGTTSNETPFHVWSALSPNPFEGPPEPPRTPERAKLIAASCAWWEWREYLPHGLPRAEYEAYRRTHIRDAAISSATKPLEAALLPEEVMPSAEALVDATFVQVADLLASYEPDVWVDHN